jgi:hypothetical protein
MLAFSFTEKYQFVAKTDRNSVFFGREAHISNRLHIMVLYINVYGFEKNSNFGLKSKGVCLQFYPKNINFRQKLTETPYFLVVRLKFQISY